MSDTEFPAQQQEPPGLTGEMRPQPDHGEGELRRPRPVGGQGRP
ncbi:hypothetical protein [Nocardioides sp. TF02-7]|nr:hypothetical protein [Nocardioides sp. TF02-7]